ncbi:basic phospholipase A2-like [Glandiceps talaboti]
MTSSILSLATCTVHRDDMTGTDIENEVVNSISKRSIPQFGMMVSCSTERNPIDFADYGCYCGLGGKGTPVDGLDRCCKVHDDCYGDAIINAGCGDCDIYTLMYRYTGCSDCAPLSEYGDAEFAYCREAICKCDAAAAQCFAQNEYNEKYVNHDSWYCVWCC